MARSVRTRATTPSSSVFAGNVAVQRHHFPVEGLPETAHCQGLGTFGVHDLQGGCRDAAGAHARAAALGWMCMRSLT
jgi:hypothetical protein